MRRSPPACALILAALLASAPGSAVPAKAADALDFRYAYPALPAGSPPHLLEAVNRLRTGQPGEAIRLLHEAPQDGSGGFERDYLLGIAHIQTRDYRTAWRHLIHAAKLAPGLADIQLTLAQLEAIQRHDEEAIGWLRRTMDRLEDPNQRLEAFSLAPFRVLHRNWEFQRLLREQGFIFTPHREGGIAPISSPEEGAPPAEPSPELPNQLKVSMQLTNFVVEALAPAEEAAPTLRLQAPSTPIRQD